MIKNCIFYIKTISDVDFRSDDGDGLQHPTVIAESLFPKIPLRFTNDSYSKQTSLTNVE
jgi:hypothetical protein